MVGRSHDHVIARSMPLNFDILTQMMFFVENKDDLFAVMCSCHTLYRAGIRPLVQSWTGISEDDLQLFHSFMVSNSPISFTAFVELSYFTDMLEPLPQTHADLLIDLLKRGVHLKTLILNGDTLDIATGLPQAIAELKNLRVLRILCNEYAAIDQTIEEVTYILSHLKSPLVKVKVCFSLRHLPDLVHLFANFRETLEETSITFARLSSTEFCYPNLTVLKLYYCFLPGLTVLITAFPNLKTLEVESGMCTDILQVAMEYLRKRSIEFQRGRRFWKSLQTLTADIAALYMMGMQHSVKNLFVTHPDLKLSSSEITWLQHALPPIQPTHLRLSLSDDNAYVLGTIYQNGKCVTRLHLIIDLLEVTECEEVLNPLFDGIGLFPNTRILQLTFKRRHVIGGNDGQARNPLPADIFLDKIDEKALADRAIALLPGLSRMVIHNIKCRRRSCWDASGEGEHKVWQSSISPGGLHFDEDP